MAIESSESTLHTAELKYIIFRLVRGPLRRHNLSLSYDFIPVRYQQKITTQQKCDNNEHIGIVMLSIIFHHCFTAVFIACIMLIKA